MKSADIPPAIREALGCHEAFRRLGFPADEIYVQLREDKMMFVILQSQGKRFVHATGVLDMTQEEFEAAWMATAEAVNSRTITDEELHKICSSSVPSRHAHAFITALLEKGFKPPVGMN